MIVSCGEALIDFIPFGETGAFRPAPGGSPFNVAVALGRLGAPVGFLGGLSRDLFGSTLSRALAESGVALDYAVLGERPSVLAFVSLGEGEAQYAFYDEGSASRLFDPVEAPALGEHVVCLHAGSISLVGEPGGSNIERFFMGQAGRRVLSIDPNLRPSLVRDEAAYRARLARMMDVADIVKVSLADLAWLAPGADPADWARERVERGAALAVLTAGGAGARAFGRGLEVALPALPVEVVDTVGAGDAFMGGFLAALQSGALLTRERLRAVDERELHEALGFATRVSAFTCTRAGADPPWARELQT